MKRERVEFAGLPALVWGERAEKAYLYLHGQGGSKEEGELLAAIACPRGWQVLSVDLPGHGERQALHGAFDPWHVLPELRRVLGEAGARWGRIALCANSIGAWFSLLAFAGQPLERCLFVSPVVDMPGLIETMMGWAGVTEERLEREQVIPTEFGQVLSWRYLCWARRHPICGWAAPTHILYAGRDNLTPRPVVERFAGRFGCTLTVLEEAEHWFHTPGQLEALRRWAAERV